MSYYTRILGTKNPDIHINELLTGLQAEGLRAKNLTVEEGAGPWQWQLITVSNDNNEPLAQIERNPVKRLLR